MTAQTLKIISWMFSTSTGKATTFAAGTSSILTVVFSLHTMAMNKIDKQETEIKTHVADKIEAQDKLYQKDVKFFIKRQDELVLEIKDLKKYLLNNK